MATKQFLYVLKPVRLAMLSDGPNAEEGPRLGEHGAYLQNLAEEGTVVLFGRTQNTDATAFGMVIFEAAPRDKAMIQKFLGRTHLYNKRLLDAINRHGLASLNVEGSATVQELSDICLQLVV